MNYDTYGQGSTADVMDALRYDTQVLRNRWRNIVGHQDYIARYFDTAIAAMLEESAMANAREQVQRVRQAVKDSLRRMEGHA